MPTERMEEVEVVCPCLHDGKHIQPATCRVCRSQDTEPPAIVSLPLAKGSLTSARLRLADAAEAVSASGVRIPVEALDTHEKQVAWLAFADKLAALRTARGEG